MHEVMNLFRDLPWYMRTYLVFLLLITVLWTWAMVQKRSRLAKIKRHHQRQTAAPIQPESKTERN